MHVVVQLLGGRVLLRQHGKLNGGSGHSFQTLTEQYNGTSWSTATSPNEGTTQNDFLTGVACISSSNCVAVGYYCEDDSRITFATRAAAASADQNPDRRIQRDVVEPQHVSQYKLVAQQPAHTAVRAA